MSTYQLTHWLPTTKKEVELRGWDTLDVILFSADAYVDHPSFGAAVIGRTIEALGLKVAIVPQPDWHGDYRDFKKLGKPRLFFGVAPGCMDSMVNKYTAARRLRKEDAYSPDGRHDLRPEYPTITAARAAIREYAAEFASDGYTLDGAAIYDHDTARCTHLFGLFQLDFFAPVVRSRSTPRIYFDVSDA